jgi:hypothetical protein
MIISQIAELKVIADIKAPEGLFYLRKHLVRFLLYSHTLNYALDNWIMIGGSIK